MVSSSPPILTDHHINNHLRKNTGHFFAKRKKKVLNSLLRCKLKRKCERQILNLEQYFEKRTALN